MAHMHLGGGSNLLHSGAWSWKECCCVWCIVRDILGVCEDVANFVLYAIYCYLSSFFEDFVVDGFWSYVE